MKTLSELFDLIEEAVASNKKGHETDIHFKQFFVNYAGHVNKLQIKVYTGRWNRDNVPEQIEQKLDEDGIQALYYFLKTRL